MRRRVRSKNTSFEPLPRLGVGRSNRYGRANKIRHLAENSLFEKSQKWPLGIR
jgi:hypothetical protein